MNDVLGYDRRRFSKLRISGEVNPEIIVGRPVDSMSDASTSGIFNYGSSAPSS